MKKLEKNFSLILIGAWILIGLGAGLISNSAPLLSKDVKTGEWFFLKEAGSFQDRAIILGTPVPFGPKELDLSIPKFSKPGTESLKYPGKVHYLGTDAVGRDILAALVHGARFSLLIVFFSALGIGIIGLLIGSIMGYFGDHFLRPKAPLFWASVFRISMTIFWLSKLGLFTGILLSGFLAIFLWSLARIRSFKAYIFRSSRVSVPIDFALNRFMETFEAIPQLFLLLVIISIMPPGPTRLLTALILAGWLTLAKIVRSKTLSFRSSALHENLEALGASNFKKVFNHNFFFVLPDLLAYVAYAAGNVVMLESGLTFLGLGVSPEQVSWGKILSYSMLKPDYWWLAVVPGILIFAVVFSLIRVGNRIYQKLLPEHRNWRYYDLA